MASIVERRREDGSMSYQVRWRQNGGWQSDTFATQRSAERFRHDVEEAGGRWPDGWLPGLGYLDEVTARTTGSTAFLEVAEQYLNARVSVSEYQMGRYRSAVARLAQTFPAVEDIDDQAVASWVRSMMGAGKAPKTIANYHGLLFGVCEYAVRKGVLTRNPCRDSRLPKRSPYDAEGEPITCFLEPHEFELIAEAMCAAGAYEWRPDRGRGARRAHSALAQTGIGYREDRDLITLAVHTGLRWGEISALRAGDIDPGGGRLTVKRAWKRNGTGDWIIGPPKTPRSRRSISLAPSLLRMLRPYLSTRHQDQYLFTNGDGGPLRQNSFYEDRWQRAVRLAQSRGLSKSPRFHDLRHTHVAWLIAGNTPLPKIQQRLGHESIKTTIDVYGGLLQETNDRVDSVVESMLASTMIVEAG